MLFFFFILDGAINLCEALAQLEERDHPIWVIVPTPDSSPLLIAATVPVTLVISENKLIPVMLLRDVQNPLRLQGKRGRNDEDNVIEDGGHLSIADVEARTHVRQVRVLSNLREGEAWLL